MPEFLDPGRSVTAADPFWLAPWLEQSGFLQAMQTSSQIRLTASHWQQFCHEWFDGFRTLKFIHFMRDNYYPSQPLSSICETEFLPVAAPENPTDLERLLEQIAAENTEPAR